MVKHPVKGCLSPNTKRNIGKVRRVKNRNHQKKKELKAELARLRREKRSTAKTLASQSLQVCSICMQKLDNSKGPDQYQTKVDIQENVSSDIVTTSTSMP